MAQLKDSTVNGNLDVSGDLIIGSDGMNVENEIVMINNNLICTISSSEAKTNDIFFGKPIYTKSFQFTTTIISKEALQIAHNLSNIENIWIDLSNSYITSVSANYNIPLISSMYYVNVGTGNNWSCAVDKTNIYLYADGGWNENWKKIVTIRYTKTTD